jgi:Cof subfamily protein (haloacid dehalogenase superfamily)
MRFSWCVCDLDGTLLDGHGAISPKDRDALARAAQAGIELILATGRTDLMAARYAYDLAVGMPVIACNGGLVRDVRSKDILHVRPIARPLVEALRRHLDGRRRDFLIYTVDEVYFASASRRVERFEDYNAAVPPALKVPLLPLSRFGREPGADPLVLKFLVADADETTAHELEHAFNVRGELTIVSSERGVVDVMAARTSKGEALTILARARGIDLARTIAFGDNYNDLSMLERCGLPIAMANAEEAVKHAARYVTLSNEESGVGDAIEKIVLADGALPFGKASAPWRT